ncbi:hypothetical protein BJV74DRAFT_248027 [Russula compacta]|nr:hypothetical protein BJV74DRAFT_248027 [Russula compacta]
MSVTTFEVGLKAQENRKCVWAPRSKKPEPLSAILTPVIASVSGSLPKLQSLDTVTVSSAKPITVPRRRRIAALPMRHNKTTALPISDPSSSAVSPPVSAPTSNNATPHAQFSRVARMTVTEETPNNITSSAVTSQYGTSPRAQYTTGTSDTVESKSILSERRKKRLPLPRRVAFQLQATQSQRQRRTPTPEAPEQSTLFSTVSRTPSLVSDTSSYADSSSSSDEFDTPPSTPPSNSDGLTSHNGLVESDDSPSKFNTTKPVGLPILANAGFPDPRKGEGTRFGFTNGNAVAERQLSFTFGA